MFTKLAEIANTLDAKGNHRDADRVTSILVALAKKNNEKSIADKILSLFEKEGVKCPECDGEMEFEPDTENYGLCNCGDDDCDCTIDMKDEVENFLDNISAGEVDCPECEDKMELKGMQCVCVNGKCKCKTHVKDMILNGLLGDSDNIRTASYKGDHEFSMARRQLLAAKGAIEEILAAMGDKEEGDLMAWTQSYLTLASDYLQSVKNYMHGNLHEEMAEQDEYDHEDDTMEDHDHSVFASKKPGNVRLNKPFRTPGAAKKFAVYVKNKKGNIVKVTFGDQNLSIKRDDPKRRKNFRARHNCDTDPRAKDRTTAKYWSCKFWSTPSVSSLLKG
jgi:hypothetical protein